MTFSVLYIFEKMGFKAWKSFRRMRGLNKRDSFILFNVNRHQISKLEINNKLRFIPKPYILNLLALHILLK